ncbi:hypothetical protein [Devriesea agamarum]|uniref:hypothetical protein n=1 Tax=Devriesea agamarum TaxID=472569 RepID=UPI00071D5C2A|nr:hypothetical protein [Devriesea agamarum]
MGNLPWDSPYRKTLKNWEWGDPQRDLLMHIAEATINANVQRGNQSKATSKDFVHLARPWEITEESNKVGSDPIPISELDDWLNGDFETDD